MALLFANQYSLLRPTSSRGTVSDHDLVRLMYYLDCVFYTIEYNDQDVREYRDCYN